MLCEPTVRLLVPNVAVPPLSVPVPSVATPSLKVTVPVAALGETVAVNVTLFPNREGLEEDASVVVVASKTLMSAVRKVRAQAFDPVTEFGPAMKSMVSPGLTASVRENVTGFVLT